MIKQSKYNFLNSEIKIPSDLITSKYHKVTELNIATYMISLLTSSKDLFFFSYPEKNKLTTGCKFCGKDPMIKHFFARRNAEILLKVNKTSSKVEIASVPSSSKKCHFDFMPS